MLEKVVFFSKLKIFSSCLLFFSLVLLIDVVVVVVVVVDIAAAAAVVACYFCFAATLSLSYVRQGCSLSPFFQTSIQ